MGTMQRPPCFDRGIPSFSLIGRDSVRPLALLEQGFHVLYPHFFRHQLKSDLECQVNSAAFDAETAWRYSSLLNDEIFSLKWWLFAQSASMASALSTVSARHLINSTTISWVRTIRTALPDIPASWIARRIARLSCIANR